jgi:hypothetical protein
MKVGSVREHAWASILARPRVPQKVGRPYARCWIGDRGGRFHRLALRQIVLAILCDLAQNGEPRKKPRPCIISRAGLRFGQPAVTFPPSSKNGLRPRGRVLMGSVPWADSLSTWFWVPRL